MNLKNYTSDVPATQSMGRIEQKLIEIGASDISKKYENQICRGITFLIMDKRTKQTLAYHLKAQVDECFKIMWEERTPQGQRQTDKKKLMEQANRTAWKILLDWTEVQCAMIMLGQAEPLQLFLPFLYDIGTQKTFYEKITSGEIPLQLNQ